MAVLNLGQIRANKLGCGTFRFDGRFDLGAGTLVTSTNDESGCACTRQCNRNCPPDALCAAGHNVYPAGERIV